MLTILTNYPIASSSADHLYPHGTANDNSRNHKFNQVLYGILCERSLGKRIVDLGCSGGGFVKDCVDDGYDAIGLEGSDRKNPPQAALFQRHRLGWFLASFSTCTLCRMEV